jgi:hypothetical protein
MVRRAWDISGGVEPEAVNADDLVKIMREWLARYGKDHPIDKPFHTTQTAKFDENGRFSGTESDKRRLFHFSGISYIVHHSGVSDRRVRGLLMGEVKWVRLSIADKILTAIGESYKLANGELEVVPNPAMSQELWLLKMQERGCI